MTTAPSFLSGFRLPRSITHVRTSFVSLVRDREKRLQELDDDQLRDRSHTLRRKVVKLDHINDEKDRATAFALMGVATSRDAQIRFYDEQLMAGYSLLRNEIAEMKTGEGKTLVGALIGYARALSGHGVHFMTTNDYLAERDFETVKPMMDRLGVSIGRIDRDMAPQQKLGAYQSDLTYGPGYEFGFDYLRDQLAMLQLPEPGLGERFQRLHRGERELSAMRMQRGHYCAIVDEADSVLIDEATTPLVLSGAAGGPTKFPQPYLLAEKISADLEVGTHFTVDPEKRRIDLTASGNQTVVRHLDETTLRFLQRPWYGYVRQALHANFHCNKDADYIALDDQIKLVDPNTGRIFDDRTWSDGLHQAVEAKEGVTVTCENRSLARISRQQYFGNYQNLCGMTGTATDGATELRSVYGLAVSRVPTHRPCLRDVYPLRVFTSEQAKWDAVAESAGTINQTGRPILVGTRTIETSETIAARLSGFHVQILNGKQDADEADLIAAAGQRGMITIATNMAGRGTDIKLGAGVADLGGLHVIVTEPHDSVRVDRQLMGRCSRQGDPGSCQTFVSAEDSLITQHAPWMTRFIAKVAGADVEVADDLTAEIAKLQRSAERKASATRRSMFSRNSWMENVMSTLAKKSRS